LKTTKDRSVPVRARRITARIERLKIELTKLGSDTQPQAAQATAQPEASQKASWISCLMGIPRQIFGSVSSATRVAVKTVTTGTRKVVGTVQTGAHKAASFMVKNASTIKASLAKVNTMMAQAISHVSESVGEFWEKYSVPTMAALCALCGFMVAVGGGIVGGVLAVFYVSLATTIALTWMVNEVLEQQQAFIVYRPGTYSC
jgi:hypothetical protein